MQESKCLFLPNKGQYGLLYASGTKSHLFVYIRKIFSYHLKIASLCCNQREPFFLLCKNRKTFKNENCGVSQKSMVKRKEKYCKKSKFACLFTKKKSEQYQLMNNKEKEKKTVVYNKANGNGKSTCVSVPNICLLKR